MYFSNFPKFLYDFNYNNISKTSVVTDVTLNVRFRKELLSSITLYDEYDIIDGETPEIISERIYGSPEYHWVIMLLNERYDHVNDFPLDEYTLSNYMISKYGSTLYDVHHYENENGFIVDSDAPGAVSVSNEQYERMLNESKRRIKLVSNDLLKTILQNYKDLI